VIARDNDTETAPKPGCNDPGTPEVRLRWSIYRPRPLKTTSLGTGATARCRWQPLSVISDRSAGDHHAQEPPEHYVPIRPSCQTFPNR
jgi:hypothetical protein